MRSVLRRRHSAHTAPAQRQLELNYSYVLHEHSSSRSVRTLLSAALDFNHFLAPTSLDQMPVTRRGTLPASNVPLLTARIGAFSALKRVLTSLGVAPGQVSMVDADQAPLAEHMFFRAPALLHVPEPFPEKVAVAALLVRPGAKSLQLECAGTFRGDERLSDALRALETLIARHVAQWQPQRPLWPAPAEVTLPDEISAPGR